MIAITIQEATAKGAQVTGGEGRRRVTFKAPVDLEVGDVVYVEDAGGRVLCVIRTVTDETGVVWERG